MLAPFGGWIGTYFLLGEVGNDTWLFTSEYEIKLRHTQHIRAFLYIDQEDDYSCLLDLTGNLHVPPRRRFRMVEALRG